jgi:hypothetical protein
VAAPTSLMADSVQRRHEAFWNRADADRPLWGVSVGLFINESYPRAMAKIRPGSISPEDIPVEEILRDCDERSALDRGLGDFPCTCGPFSGIPWLEAIAGCSMMASPTGFWAEPCCEHLGEWHPPAPASETGWGRKLLELERALVAHANGRYQVSPVLMRGPLDIAAAVRGASGLVLDLVDSPGTVETVLGYGAQIWEDIGRAQLELIPASRHGYFALEAGLRVWAPDKLLWLQEDAMALLSPDLYRRHVLPLDRRLSETFACVAFHLHGSALWAIDDLVLVPGIDVLELNHEDARCDVEGTFAGWKKIQEFKPLVVWRRYDGGFRPWLDRVLRELRPAGLNVQVAVRNGTEAEAVAGEFRAACKRLEVSGHGSER